MIGVFCSLDLVIFYLFFEGGLIPMFLIIGIWGGERRVYSAFKFFLFTLLGSVLMLIAVISIYWIAGTTDVEELYKLGIDPKYQNLLWLAFFSSFAVLQKMKRMLTRVSFDILDQCLTYKVLLHRLCLLSNK